MHIIATDTQCAHRSAARHRRGSLFVLLLFFPRCCWFAVEKHRIRVSVTVHGACFIDIAKHCAHSVVLFQRDRSQVIKAHSFYREFQFEKVRATHLVRV